MIRIVRMGAVVCAMALVAAGPPVGAQFSDFRWTGAIERGKTLEIKGVNGDIRAEAASGDQVEVVATKRSRRSDVNSVTVEVVPHDGHVTICALYPTPRSGWPWYRVESSHPNECLPNQRGHMNVKDNDVAVDFTVRLPQGVKLQARTVNGTIDARSLKSDAEVRTVNGRIALRTTGQGSAHTVNGTIEASIGDVSGTTALEFQTVNGSISLEVPKDANARLRARLVNGRFNTTVPLLVQSFRARPREVDGVIGKGGRELEMHTVNGSINLQFATD